MYNYIHVHLLQIGHNIRMLTFHQALKKYQNVTMAAEI